MVYKEDDTEQDSVSAFLFTFIVCAGMQSKLDGGGVLIGGGGSRGE